MIAGQNRSPAILIECGYLSHPKEDARIATESYRQSLADGIAGGVQNYIRARRKESIVPIRAVAGGAPCPKNIRAIRQIRAS